MYICDGCPYHNLYRAIYSITINRAARTLTLYKDGRFQKSYPVAVGRPSMPTPAGTFRIINKQVNPVGPYGARWMGLSRRGIGIHGTNNPNSIGTYASHGCIRMFNNHVIELFNIVPVGTVVTIV